LARKALRDSEKENVFGQSDGLLANGEYYSSSEEETKEGMPSEESMKATLLHPPLSSSSYAATVPTSSPFPLKPSSPSSSRLAQTRSRTIYLTLMAAIGGFLFGYDTGVVSGATLLIKDDFGLSPEEQEVVVTSTVAACAVFSLVGGTLNGRYGRRPVLLAASAVFALGALVMGFAGDYTMLVVGRCIVGVGIGFTSVTAPM